MSIFEVPTLETERIILRPLSADDAEAVLEWAGDERVNTYLPYSLHRSPDDSRLRLESLAKAENEYQWGSVRKSDNKLIGSGVMHFHPDTGEWSFGYNIRYDYWNKGYTTEMTRGMIRSISEKYTPELITAECAAENIASVRVMEKCGMTFVGFGEYSRYTGAVPIGQKSTSLGAEGASARSQSAKAITVRHFAADHTDTKGAFRKMLRLENIAFSADNDGRAAEIIRGINLEIPDDKFIVITGPNGGGKSTLAKLIAGIEKPTAGKLYLDDTDITDMSITERARAGIGFAFQQPVRFKGLTVLDLLRIAAGKKLSVSEACEYLSEVGLCAKDYIGREVNASLSGGELKRIEIATVLARDVKLAVFDEPEAGIDLWSFNNLIRIFEKMRVTDRKRTVIVISHQERILNIADEIIVLSDGQVIDRGDKERVLPEIVGTKYTTDICPKME